MSDVNGFENGETSAVYLQMANNNAWSRWANESAECAVFNPGSARERVSELARRYRQRIEETCNPCYPGGLHAEMIESFCARVNWREVARRFYNRAAEKHRAPTLAERFPMDA